MDPPLLPHPDGSETWSNPLPLSVQPPHRTLTLKPQEIIIFAASTPLDSNRSHASSASPEVPAAYTFLKSTPVCTPATPDSSSTLPGVTRSICIFYPGLDFIACSAPDSTRFRPHNIPSILVDTFYRLIIEISCRSWDARVKISTIVAVPPQRWPSASIPAPKPCKLRVILPQSKSAITASQWMSKAEAVTTSQPQRRGFIRVVWNGVKPTV
ncbi:hypothetical protein BJ322DRAFT_1024324 [Thelephora terrestris]|uniref:Uncharacterized protein n=1 Tax=Thelephora terrestris TaxID=56493 RepID=A0A9P6H4L1_9AGAM|nr:hypothetical protein BJ322DRAFT_1024324 [Thelephora terrestris]